MENKLYILVDKGLSCGQKIAQACHAVAEHQELKPGEWENHTIVILDAPRFMLQVAIKEGAIGFQDEYYSEPKACAFTCLPGLEDEIKQLSLAR